MTWKILMIFKKRGVKVIIGLTLCFLVYTWVESKLLDNEEPYIELLREVKKEQALRTHTSVVTQFYKGREEWTTSALGWRLFKYEDFAEQDSPQNKTFVILVWKYWDWLKKRHLYNYRREMRNPLDDCSVTNCIFTGEDDKLPTADAVVVHLQHGDIPETKNRPRQQRWIFLNDEAPKNAFSLSKNNWKLKELENIFNWSMTYRTDADIPVPYGRTVPVKDFKMNNLVDIIPNWKKKRRDVPAAILISNCAVKYRMDFINELQKYMPVDVYGECSKNVSTKKLCPGHFRSDCDPISEYLFYLVLENSSCREYLTEKVWYHAYSKGAVPIIMGPSSSDCKNLLPPFSYIHVAIDISNNTMDMQNLAKQILSVAREGNDDILFALHEWRLHFQALNEHGYFQTKSYHLCRICEALNYNDAEEKIYNENDLKWFLDPTILCESGQHNTNSV